jgi:hypothetical protein
MADSMPSKQIRKIHVNGRDFLWSYPSPWIKMSIFTPDKKFLVSYEPEIIQGPPMWSHKGMGTVTVHKAELPELAPINGQMTFHTPDWSDIWVATPKMARRVIVYIFERLAAVSDKNPGDRE